MKSIVIWYSLTGNVTYAAQKIAETLQADTLQLKPVVPYPEKGIMKWLKGGKSASAMETPQLMAYSFLKEEYDTVVLAMPIWAGKVTPPLHTFLQENDLSGKNVAALICCMGGPTGKGFDAMKEMAHQKEFVAELTLVDPKVHPDGVDEKIREFCEHIRENSQK